MISSKHRFRGRRDPRIVLKYGESVRGKRMQIRYLLNNNSGQKGFRAAVIVSAKVAKNAPMRNRIRRRIYELIREQNIKPNADLVILVFDKQLAVTPHQELKNELSQLLKRTKILKIA